MVDTVLTEALLQAGLRNDFAGTYDPIYAGILENLGPIADLSVPSNKRTETYGYFESSPSPGIWNRGEAISESGYDSVNYSVTNFNWGHRIRWHQDDREDDQTQSLFRRARDTATKMARLDERIFFQVLLNATDVRLLQAIPLAPDGAAWFAATANSVDRFGVSGGNILTGAASSGIASVSAIQTDFFTALGRFKQFQDTDDEPLLDDSAIEAGATILYGAGGGRDEVFKKAFNAQLILESNASNSAAGVSNAILAVGMGNTNVRSTSRITTDDWFIILHGTTLKPFFKQNRRSITEAVSNKGNSDNARDLGEEYIQWDFRAGYSLNIPYQSIQVDN